MTEPKPSTLHQHVIWRIGVLITEIINGEWMTESQKGRLKEQLGNLLETDDILVCDARDFVVLVSGQAEKLAMTAPQESTKEVADLLTEVIKKLKKQHPACCN